MTVDRELPLTSLQGVLLVTGLLLFLWASLTAYVNKKGRFRWAETLLETHHFITASLSLVLAAYVLDIGHDVLTARTGYNVDPYILGYLYHLLKIYEYLDIILAIMSGTTKISKYEAFSHLSLPLWSYYRIIDRPHDSIDWRLQVIADCFVRSLSRAVPWVMEDVKLEETILTTCIEGRWYADLAMSGFWAFFTFQGQRESEQAVKVYGKPCENEATTYFLSAAVMLYAGYAKRQEDAERAQKLTRKGQAQSPPQVTKDTAASPDAASRSTGKDFRQSSRRKR